MPAPMALKRAIVAASMRGACAIDQCRFAIGVVLLTASNVSIVSLSSAGDSECCWNAQPCFAMNSSAV